MSVSISELQPSSQGPHDRDVVVFFDDPGARDFFEPVLPYLAADPGLRTRVVVGGYSKRTEHSLLNVEMRPIETEDEGEFNPVFIASGISADPQSFKTLLDRFPDIPTLLAEDYYRASNGYFDRHIDYDHPLPDHILTIDEVAKNEIISRNGRNVIDLASRIEVSGHPALDYLADRTSIQTERGLIRERLGLTSDDVLLSCFTSTGVTDLIKQFAEELGSTCQNLKVAFHPHPRDTKHNIALYERLFQDADVKLCTTEGLNYRQMIAGADAVAVLPHSTVSLHAIGQGVPTFHIDTIKRSPEDAQVPVQYGLSQLVSPADFGAYMKGFSKKRYEMDLAPRSAAQKVAYRIGELSSSISVEVV